MNAYDRDRMKQMVEGGGFESEFNPQSNYTHERRRRRYRDAMSDRKGKHAWHPHLREKKRWEVPSGAEERSNPVKIEPLTARRVSHDY